MTTSRQSQRLTVNDHIQVLDYVLANTHEQRDYFHVKEFFCDNNPNFPENDEYFLKMVLNKLQKDGLIDFIRIAGKVGQYVEGVEAGEGFSVRRNFDGHIFFKNGGYQGAEERKIQQETNESLYRERAETLAKRLADWTEKLANRTSSLMVATWAVAIGAIGLVIWEIFHFVLEKILSSGH